MDTPRHSSGKAATQVFQEVENLAFSAAKQKCYESSERREEQSRHVHVQLVYLQSGCVRMKIWEEFINKPLYS